MNILGVHNEIIRKTTAETVAVTVFRSGEVRFSAFFNLLNPFHLQITEEQASTQTLLLRHIDRFIAMIKDYESKED